MNYSYKTFFQKLYQNQKKQYVFDSKTREEALTWQREFRETLRKSLGLEQLEILASGLTEVPIVQEEVQEDGYLRKKIVLETLPDVFMPFYMLIPDGTDRKHPSRAMIAIPAHGANKNTVCGVGKTEEECAKSAAPHWNAMAGNLSAEALWYSVRILRDMGKEWSR